jgi:hypothetical protein
MKGPCPLLLTSVQHSGTQFYQQIIHPNRLEHTNSPRISILISTAEVVACAIRRPEDVWQSWWHRREGLNADNSGPGPDFIDAWGLLGTWVAMRPDTYFLPIDHDSRDDRLEALSKKMDMPMVPDWDAVLGARNRDRGPAPPMDMSRIYEIPIIKELYEWPIP